MIKFEDLTVGQEVFVNHPINHPNCKDDGIHDQNGWLKVKISVLIGDREPNPGRTLVEVASPWLECGWGMYDVEDIYPAPDFEAIYEMVDIVERIPDNRTYEFGISGINQADDTYYLHSQEIKPTGQRRMIVLKKCDGCGGEFPAEWMMNASLGRACPDCYDRMSN